MKISQSNQILASVRFKVFLSAVVLLVTSLGFNALFNFTTLDKLYSESAEIKLHVIGEDFRRDIKRSLFTGQTIQEIKGINGRQIKLKQGIQPLAFGAEVSIYLPDGQLLYSTEVKQSNRKVLVPLEDPDTIKKNKLSFSGDSSVITQKGIRFLQLPVQDAQKNWVATVIISFKKESSIGLFKGAFKKQILSGILLLLAGIGGLVLSLNGVFSRSLNSREIPGKKITGGMFLIIAPILVIFSSLNIYNASKQYLEITQKKAWMTLALAKQDIESFLVQGLTLEEAVKTDGRFLEMLKPYPILDSLIILDNEENWILGVKQEITKNPSVEYHQMADLLFSKVSFLNKTQRLELFKEKNKPASGSVIIRISKDQFVREAVNMILNAITVVAISILLLIEILIFIFYFVDKPVSREKVQKTVHYGLIRPVIFLFLFGIDISISFIPLHMEKLFTPMFGLSRDAVMGFPISVEFFFVGISIFFCGFWNDRRGWYEPFLTGLFLAGTGVLYSWLAPNVVHFVISRAIVGTGYGLTFLAAQGFVIEFSDEKNRARAFAQFISGLYAGSICGGATGALLAEKFGYRWVFFIGAIILYSIIVYSLVFMRKAMIRPQKKRSIGLPPSVSGESIFSGFLKNRIVLSLILLSSLPASIAAVGFLNYFSPIYLNRIGASQGTIGRVLMVYGFSLVYLGPVIAKFVDRFDNKKNYVFVGCLLGSIAFLMFYFLDGLLAVIIAVLLLGLSNSFIIASQSTYLLGLKVTHILGAGKAIGIFRGTSRIGQSLGPIIFSGFFLSENIKMSITKLGFFYLLTAVLFLVFTQKDASQYARSL